MFDSLLAQVTGPDMPPWLQGGVLTVMVSLFSWWIYHTTSTAIPKMHQEQREHVEKIVTKSNDTIKMLVDEFRADSKEQRAVCAEEKRLIWEQIQARKIV